MTMNMMTAATAPVTTKVSTVVPMILPARFRLRTLATELEMEANTSGTTTQNIILMNTVLDKVTKFRKEPASHAAGYHGKQHQGQEAVVLHNCGFVHNNTSLSSNTQNCRWGMRRHLLSQCTAPAAALSLKGAVPRR